jgi:hypothetical protein
VGTDLKGPYLGVGAFVFVDKASGFIMNENAKIGRRNKDSVDNNILNITSNIINRINAKYVFYKQKINVLRSDSHSIFKSKATKDVCIQLHINQKLSAPGQKQLNGLAEVTIQHLQNKVTSMFCYASYAPRQLWPLAWDHAVAITNIKNSRIPGSNVSRYEEFTKLRPDYKKMVLLPWGSPLHYHDPEIT